MKSMKTWRWIVLVTIVLLVTTALSQQEDVQIKTQCTPIIEPYGTFDHMPFVVIKDSSPLRLGWWETFTPTKIEAFQVGFKDRVSSTPTLQVKAGQKILLSYHVERLKPHHSDTGTYPEKGWGFQDGGSLPVQSLTLRSSDPDLVLSEANGVPLLCPGWNFSLTGVRTNLIAYWIDKFIDALKRAKDLF
jgi:hypothetical protein